MALSDIKVKPMSVTWDGLDLGSTSGGVSITPAAELVDIVADQQGSQPIDSVLTGVSISVTMTLLELNAANYNKMIGGAVGAEHNDGGTAVVGYGTSKNFSNMLANASGLQLRPIGNSDASEDWYFWKALPEVTGLSFVADSANSIEVTFRIYADTSKDSQISLGLYGDHTQAYLDA